MTLSLDPRELEELVRAVTREVLAYLRGEPETTAPLIAAAGSLSASAAAAIAARIDHTLLRPGATGADIETLCREAVRYGFACICVNPSHVPLAARLTRGSPVKVCAVVGFPLGATLPSVKIAEAAEVIKLGATEIDVVQNVGALRSGRHDEVEAELRALVEIAHAAGALCKVILETALLTDEVKVQAALLARRAGADFVKTSTGFAARGATAADVALLRAAVGPEMGIKAAGGIRTLADFQAMVAAGATRIGTSSGVEILREASRLPTESAAR